MISSPRRDGKKEVEEINLFVISLECLRVFEKFDHFTLHFVSLPTVPLLLKALNCPSNTMEAISQSGADEILIKGRESFTLAIPSTNSFRQKELCNIEPCTTLSGPSALELSIPRAYHSKVNRMDLRTHRSRASTLSLSLTTFCMPPGRSLGMMSPWVMSARQKAWTKSGERAPNEWLRGLGHTLMEPLKTLRSLSLLNVHLSKLNKTSCSWHQRKPGF